MVNLEASNRVTQVKPVKLEAPPRRRETADTMATRQKDIAVSEFFAKNRHLLGFDNPRKALLTTVKEAVDNSLDACEEAGILPDITVVIEELGSPALRAGPGEESKGPGSESRGTQKTSRYRVTVVDNGPGIVRAQVENIFGRLLYGSKFHRLKMSRGFWKAAISRRSIFSKTRTRPSMGRNRWTFLWKSAPLPKPTRSRKPVLEAA